MERTSISLPVVVVLSMVLAGCASAPTQQQIATADYGTPMTESQCLATAENHIAGLLKDPSSAQFRGETPCTKGWSGKAPLLGMAAVSGYVQTGQVNGKNSFGGYVGFRNYEVVMKNGRVMRSCIADQHGACLLTDQ